MSATELTEAGLESTAETSHDTSLIFDPAEPELVEPALVDEQKPVITPNMLSTARAICSLPLAIGLIRNPRRWIMPTVLLHGTDWLDGKRARKYDLVSERGAGLDKLGDSALETGVFVAALASEAEPAWLKAVTIGQKAYTASAILRYKAAGESLPPHQLLRPAHILRAIGLTGLVAAEALKVPPIKKLTRGVSIGSMVASSIASAVITTGRHRKLNR